MRPLAATAERNWVPFPTGPGGDLLRPHHLRVVLRLVALVSDVVEHHIHGSAGPPPWCATSSTGWPGSPDSARPLQGFALAPGDGPGVWLVEVWRGLLCHRVVLDGAGRLTRVAVVDPSFMTWPGLTVALEATIVPRLPSPTRASTSPTSATTRRYLDVKTPGGRAAPEAGGQGGQHGDLLSVLALLPAAGAQAIGEPA